MADKLTALREKTVVSLAMSNQLTRSQLRMGPLVHVKQRMCDTVLNSIIRDDYAIRERVQGDRGAPAIIHRVTTKGRKYAEEILQRRDSEREGTKVIGRESGAGNSL